MQIGWSLSSEEHGPARLVELAGLVERHGFVTLGVGSGEALNEHILGDRWPPAPQRMEMLEEAVDVSRRLWTGGSVRHHGTHYVVENARIFDAPEHPPPIVMSAFGPIAVDAAARCADGLWTHADSSEFVEAFERAGGSGPRYGQVTFCWADDRDDAIATALRVWPNSSLPGQLSQDLPTPRHFEEMSAVVTGEMLVETTPSGDRAGSTQERIGSGDRRAVQRGAEGVEIVGPEDDP